MSTGCVCKNDGVEKPYGATKEELGKFYEAYPCCVEVTSFSRGEGTINTLDTRFFDKFKDALIFAKTHSEEEEGDGEEDIECDVIKDNCVILVADRDYTHGFRAWVRMLADDLLSDVTDVFGCSVDDVGDMVGVTWHLN